MISRNLPNKSCCWCLEQRFQVEDTSWANRRSSKYISYLSKVRVTCSIGWLAGGTHAVRGFPGGSVVKNLSASAGDVGLIPGRKDPLEKEMATHSSILSWRIPWTEEPGGLQSTGLQRVRLDWITEHTHAAGCVLEFELCSLGPHFPGSVFHFIFQTFLDSNSPLNTGISQGLLWALFPGAPLPWFSISLHLSDFLTLTHH